MFRKQIAIAAAAIGLLVPAAPALAAGSGQYGVAQPGGVSCRPDGLYVTAPNIEPLAIGLVGGWELTGYVSILKRWDPARAAWVTVSRSVDFYHEADGLVIPPEWFTYLDPASGRVRGTEQGPFFPMAGRKGYFSVTHEFYWLNYFNGKGTGAVLGRLETGPGPVFDERPYTFGYTAGYCLY